MKRYIAMVVLLVTAGGLVTELSKRQRRERDAGDFTPEMQAELDRLSELAGHANPEKRREAIEGLQALGSLEAMPVLVEALSDPNSGVRIAAIRALEHLDYRIGAAGCRNLLRLARDSNPEVRSHAERALPKLCEWRAAPLILAEAQRPDCENISFLFSLLEYCTGHTIPAQQESGSIAQDASPAETRQADKAYMLTTWRDWFEHYKDKMPVDWLIDDLGAPSAQNRARAADLLGKIGDPKAKRHLIDALDDKDENVRRKALGALVKLKAVEAAPRISALYLNAKGDAARECEKALKQLVRPEHIDALVSGLAQADKKKQGAYSRLLEIASGHRAPDGEDVISHWTEYAARVKGLSALQIYAPGMKDKDPRNRFEAAGRMKAFGRKAIDYLLAALDDESQAVRGKAATTLRAVTFHYEGYKPGGPPDDRRKAAARWRSWWESKKDEETVKRLTAQLEDRRDARNRVEAAIGLKEIDAWRGVPCLIKALSEDSEGLRYYAARALRSITKQSFGFVSNAPPDERNSAIEKWRSWWAGAGEMDKERALIATIRSIAAGRAAKIRAIRALAEMRSEKAVVALANLLDDDSFVVSSAAKEALEKITKKSFFYSPREKDSGGASSSAQWLQYLESLRKDKGNERRQVQGTGGR
ncbi:MAG: hypothetical protein DRP79_01355 [Planctomycetota bacterium]|nr:MAG: hypothetical protein DRP79_01355 [Planctomycetota bacterium]